MTTTTENATHHCYAEEAESAQRGNAWKQAAALWRMALKRVGACSPGLTDAQRKRFMATYTTAIEDCNEKARIEDAVNKLLDKFFMMTAEDTGRADVPISRLRCAMYEAMTAGRDGGY